MCENRNESCKGKEAYSGDVYRKNRHSQIGNGYALKEKFADLSYSAPLNLVITFIEPRSTVFLRAMSSFPLV